MIAFLETFARKERTETAINYALLSSVLALALGLVFSGIYIQLGAELG